MKQDYELSLFSKAMNILVSSSQLKFDPFHKDVFVSSIGILGYGTIGDFNRLAGAMNFIGLRTKTGKYITGDNLKKIKQTPTTMPRRSGSTWSRRWAALLEATSGIYLSAKVPGGITNGTMLTAADGKQIASWDKGAQLARRK